MSILEFEEWQAFFSLRDEHLEKKRAEMKREVAAGNAAGGKGVPKVDTNPPVIGSGRKKAKGR